MLDQIRKLLKSNSSADLSAALEQIDIDALRAGLAAAETKRQELLLTGTDPQIVAAEAAITAARLNLDRAVAAKDAIAVKKAAAQVREADEAFIRDRAAVVRQCDTARRELETKLRAPVEEITRIRRLVAEAEEARIVIYRRMATDPSAESAASQSSEVPAFLPDLAAAGMPGWAIHAILNAGEVRHEL